MFAPGKQTCLCEALLRNEEAWLSRTHTHTHKCVSLPRPLPLVLPFIRSCLDSYSLFHANILERSSSLLLCRPRCVFLVLLRALSRFWKIKVIRKRENLRREKKNIQWALKRSRGGLGQTAEVNFKVKMRLFFNYLHSKFR